MDNLVPNITEFINSAKNKSPSIRRKGIQNISNLFQSDEDAICELFHNQLSPIITNLISDPSESVREFALQLLLKISDTLQLKININYLATLLPILWNQLACTESKNIMMKFRNNDDDFVMDDRINTKPESSEEIRCLIIQLLTKVISINYNNSLQFFENNENKYCLQYLNILHLFFNDKCPNIRILACELLLNQINKYYETNKDQLQINRNNTFFKYIFDDYAEYLCVSLAKGCNHQRSKIRLMSFKLLSKIIENNFIIQNGNISLWIIDEEKIWKYITKLNFDQNKSIKNSLAINIFEWIKLLTKNKNNLTNINYAKIWMLLLNENGLNILHNGTYDINIEECLLKSVEFIVKLSINTINNWKVSYKLFGITCLCTLMLCLKSQLPSQYFLQILPNFRNLIESNNENIIIKTNECLKLFGKFMPIDGYLNFLFSKFNNEISVCSYLKISSQIFSGYDINNISNSSLIQVFQSLSDASFGNNSTNNIGIQLMDTILCLLKSCNQNINVNNECILNILWSILRVQANQLQLQNTDRLFCDLNINESDNSALHFVINDITNLLKNNDNNTVSAIWETYFKSLYQRIDFNNKTKNSYYLFAALIHYSKSFAVKYLNDMLIIFCECNNDNNSDFIKYSLLSILHLLLNNTTNINDLKNYTETVIIDILLPNLVWKVGKFRFGMRLLSVECMLILYKNKSVANEITWKYRNKLLSTLKSRLDDFEVEIRCFIIQIFEYVLLDLSETYNQNKSNNSDPIIKEKAMQSLSNSILERFDDSSDKIRILTCKTLQTFVRCLNKQKLRDTKIYKNIIQTSLVHLDDANHEVQKAVFVLLDSISCFDNVRFVEQLKLSNQNNNQCESNKLIQKLIMKNN